MTRFTEMDSYDPFLILRLGRRLAELSAQPVIAERPADPGPALGAPPRAAGEKEIAIRFGRAPPGGPQDAGRRAARGAARRVRLWSGPPRFFIPV
jgi:hypothetical protein